MLLTVLYMIATMVQLRRISFLKAHLQAVFNRNRPSFILYNESFQQSNKDHNGSKQEANGNKQEANGNKQENFISSDLCLNKNLARLSELIWYQNNIKLCTVYPEQLVNVSNWLAYPYGKSLFPLNAYNCYTSSSTSNCRINILVEADLTAYKPQASRLITKLENYGLIITWTANKNVNFILESDADDIKNFLITVMQGQHYINNDLLITRVQSVSVSGQPCIYDKEQLNSADKDLFYALSDAARIAAQQDKSIEIAKFDMKVYPQKKDLSKVISTSSVPTTEENPIKITSSTAPVASVVSLTRNTSHTSHKHKLDEESTSAKDTSLSKLTSTAIREKIDDTAKYQLPSTSERKDASAIATSSSSNNETDFTKGPMTSETTPLACFEPSQQGKMCKPPNVVFYADSPEAINNIRAVLKQALDSNRYIIYALTINEARSNSWMDQVALVVVCGNVDAEISAQLVEYVIHGGKLLALCSNMLHTLLPSFKTAEVRESELVHFSYGKWKRVRMMHDIFCYHASPVRARFFQDHEDTRTSALNPPTSISVKDKRERLHSFDVKVLGTEETWHNPSILLATLASTGGRVVFSQIHLEVDPMQYEYEENKFNALKESNAVRLEIIGDLLSTHLGMETKQAVEEFANYTPAFFLGKFEVKMKMLNKLKSQLESDMLKMPKLSIRFYTESVITESASESFLPVMVHMCPANFSTVKYFESLNTNELGRLVIYADVLTSSMHLMEKHLEHGLAVIPRQQTQAQGRSRNLWLGPTGCAMFTLQLHISKNAVLGGRISLLQHIAAVALVSAIRSIPGYEDIDLRLKWPNDIYIGNSIKIGGLIVTTQVDSSQFTCNIGAGINLSNSKPTTCINDVIEQYNQKYKKKLSKFSYEQYLAFVFNELEKLLDVVQNYDMQHFYNLYYKYWLHANSKITVIKSKGKAENVTISGINDYGYLLVQANDGTTFYVQPDGNSFDLLKGLIKPKQ